MKNPRNPRNARTQCRSARTIAGVGVALLATLIGVAGCRADKPADTTAAPETSTSADISTAPAPALATITLVAYDSFALSKGTLEQFKQKTGITVKVLTNGDAGEVVSKAVLTKGNPLGDVLWGVDNTFLDRAVKEQLFEPYEASTKPDLAAELTALVPGNEVTPVDYGDVCVNYDKAALAAKGVPAPATLEDLADPKYKGQLVVENPATSSPGLAFLLATVAHFGADGWLPYWKSLKANGVLVVNGWTEAYETWFAGGTAKGDRPLVVSYASSPPAAVLFGPDPKATVAPTGVVDATCFRQVEFAGILKGTKHLAEAQKLIDFLSGTIVQEDLQLNMFVFPANTKATLAKAFIDFAARPAKPLTLSPAEIAANRDTWIDEWTKAAV